MGVVPVMLAPPGVSGSLLPLAYLVSGLEASVSTAGPLRGRSLWPSAAVRGALQQLWNRAVARCGPASGLRTLYDSLADPLFGALTFDARNPLFHRRHATALLLTPRQSRVALMLLPWADAPSSAVRETFLLATQLDTSWAFVLAPPYLSLCYVPALASRRRLDFVLPRVVEDEASPFWVFTSAAVFDPTAEDGPAPIDILLDQGRLFHDRVREDLQLGVASAFAALKQVVGVSGIGRQVNDDINEGQRQVLTIIYRILFLLFAESRELVPATHPIYKQAYSVGALARDAIGGDHLGAWDSLAAMSRLARQGCRSASLTVAPFGGALFSRRTAAVLEPRQTQQVPAGRADRRDAALGQALTLLASRRAAAGRQLISYRDLGVEELGAVYERLLDLPAAPTESMKRGLSPAEADSRDSARKLTGTFYTPQPLAEFIVRRTLAPLVHGASSETVLNLRVVDPAMGSGACLIAACRYLAAAYEQALIEEGTAAPGDFDEHERAEIRRMVAGRCLAGVDRNPVAVELARLSLWLATLAHGRPLGFLDHRLRTGDSLVGAWPDDLRHLSMTSRRSAVELPLFDMAAIEPALERVSQPLMQLSSVRDDSLADVTSKASAWRNLSGAASPLSPWRRALSLWCARWFWPLDRRPPSAAEVRATLDVLLGRATTLPVRHVHDILDTAADVGQTQRFFHWPLEFPDVFHPTPGTKPTGGGFDAVIGNPPWEMLRRSDGRSTTDVNNLVGFIRQSRHYPSCGQGHLNLYQAFVDRSLALVRPGGRVGLVVPWGLASDDGAAALRRRLLDTTAIGTFVGLENSRGLFPIHRGVRFAAIVTTAAGRTGDFRTRFGVSTASELDSLPEVDDPLAPAYPVVLNRKRVASVGGPLLRIPDVRDARDLDLAADLAHRFPRLGDPAGWGATFGRELNATEAHSAMGSGGLAVIDGKHVSPFAVDTTRARRIERTAAERLSPQRLFDRERLAYRDVSAAGNALTLIAAVVPAGVVTTHTLFCLKTALANDRQHFLAALFNSWVLNSVVRLLIGQHATTSLVEGLAVPLFTNSRRDRWIAAAARRLSLSRPGAPDYSTLLPRLQATVAHRCGLDRAAFQRVLERVPLIDAGLRANASRCFAALDRAGPDLAR